MLFFNKIDDKTWQVSGPKSNTPIAHILANSPGIAYISEINCESPPMLLSVLETLALGTRMIADRHPDTLNRDFKIDYRRVKFARQFLSIMENGSEDTLNGFMEAARTSFGRY